MDGGFEKQFDIDTGATNYAFLGDDEERNVRRRLRREQMRREKRKQIIFRRCMLVILPLVIIGILFLVIRGIGHGVTNRKGQNDEILGQNDVEIATETLADMDQSSLNISDLSDGKEDEEPNYIDAEYGPYADIYSDEKEVFFDGYKVSGLDSAAYPSEEDVLSNYALLIDADDGHVVASRQGGTRINPASMTKILTVLVAAEHVVDLDDTFLIDISITDYAYKHDCSAVGFAENEIVTVRDLMYGTILPSGADAALGLAEYVAGSEERFVDMMNDKLEELGLSNTAHFTNCVGIYDENHYCTLVDMAMIMKAAVENDLAREILTAHTYTTSATEAHPEGITISNWFLRRIEDKDTLGEVECAKTGFVNQSGCCAASYEISNTGKHYICVTADAWSSWRCIYDHVAIYDAYVK